MIELLTTNYLSILCGLLLILQLGVRGARLICRQGSFLSFDPASLKYRKEEAPIIYLGSQTASSFPKLPTLLVFPIVISALGFYGYHRWRDYESQRWGLKIFLGCLS